MPFYCPYFCTGYNLLKKNSSLTLKDMKMKIAAFISRMACYCLKFKRLKINKIKLSALLLSFLICCLSRLSLAQEREKTLDDFFSTINRNGEISGSVLVTENGK